MLQPIDPRDRFTFKAAEQFRGSVRPVYGIKEGESRLQHIASCLLLNVDGTPVVSTAAHVIDFRRDGTLFVGGVVGGQMVHIHEGISRSTTAPNGNRSLDRMDCAFWVPPISAVEALGNVQFLDESRLCRDAPTSDTLYTAYGYPVSRNKKNVDHVSKSVDTRISMYTSNVLEMPELIAKLGVSGQEHLFFSFSDRSYSSDGAEHNTFGPKGLSGGALLRLGEFTGDDFVANNPEQSAMLSGMLIEHHENHGALVAVKIGSIVDGIRRVLKALPR